MVRWSRAAPRAVIAAAAVLLAVEVSRTGVAAWLQDGNPVLAARLAPRDARIAAAAARASIATPADIQTPAIDRLVNAALSRDVTLPSAIELRALRFETAGNGGRAERLFALSDAISRRSLPTRLWLIQRSVDRGDVAGALGNFDIALRTSNAAPDILFPVLAGATSDPTLVAPIARILDRPSDWRAMFLNFAIGEGGAAAGINRVVMEMRDRKAITDNQIDDRLVGQLVSEHAYRQARRVHEAFHPRSGSAALVSDPDFTNPELGFPFGWGLSESGSASAARDMVDGRAALTFQASPGGGGQVATQLLMLTSGPYRISTRTAAAADSSSPPFWTLTCGRPNGKQIALVDQPAEKGAVAYTDFTVPAGCDAQWLAFNLRPSESPEGQSGAVAAVTVMPRQGD